MQTKIRKIKDLTATYYEEIVDVRRHIHKHPELSFKEYKTRDYVINKLKEYGIKEIRQVTETGVVAIIKGEAKIENVKKIALRADMDALELNEERGAEYVSQNKGVMHACGHDVHTAILLGVARVINEMRGDFGGDVMLIFQPAEETFPGGAISMMQAGLFSDFNPNYVYGLHVQPLMESGYIGMKKGDYMASTDEIYLMIKGRGGHAATPELLIDPVIISANILVGLQQISSRSCPSNIPMVLSFGKIVCEGRTNIIPDKVELQGTLRTMNEEWRYVAHKKINDISTNIAKSYGAECDVNIAKGYPVLRNNEEAVGLLYESASEILGNDKILDLDYRMTAEDFAYYSNAYKSCFFRLGISNKDKYCSNLHTSTFDVDEQSIKTGMQVMVWNAVRYLTVEH